MAHYVLSFKMNVFQPFRKSHPIIRILNYSLIDLPAPINLSAWWNFGSLLGLCLVIQILTGLILAIHYTADADLAFSSVSHIIRDVEGGWLYRLVHANGASAFFACLYLHIGRGMYYGSYINIEVWNIGVVLFLGVMITAFLGYVLPWGQMSFWGATVITRLATAVPYAGKDIVLWLWGGYAVGNATLKRFFVLHFILPFILAALRVLHLFFLHVTGSNNPLGINRDVDKIPFHPYYLVKDLFGIVLFRIIFFCLVAFYPNVLIDPVNYIPADPYKTPLHIQPEWYFLFAYAILRSIPNKVGGVLALGGSVLVLFLVPLFHCGNFRRMSFYPINQILFWRFIVCFCLLTWVGTCPVWSPFIECGQVLTVLYFLYFPFSSIRRILWDSLILK